MRRTQIQLSTQALEKLFRVNCLHHYYGDKVCKDFELTPSPETETELRNARLTFKQLPGGGIVFYHTSQSTPVLKSPAFRPKKLTFLIHQRNRNFLHFSELAYLPDGAFLYFNNLKKNADKAGHQLLHPGEFAQPNEKELVYNMPKAFDFGFEKEVAYRDVQVHNQFGEQISLPDLDEEAAVFPQKRHHIDLSGEEEGRYVITVKGKKAPLLDCYVGDSSFEECFGVIDLFMRDEVDSSYQIANNKSITYQEYHLQINARATYWRYCLINRTDAIFSNQSITSKDNQIKFSKPETITLRNGAEAIRLTSHSPIPLRQFAEHKFELTMKKNGRSLRSPILLPIPSTQMIKPDPENQEKIYSDMFVYL